MSQPGRQEYVIKHRLMHGLPLPNDLILLLVTFLEPEDVLSLRATCSRLEAATRRRWPWRAVLQRTVIDRGLPLPSALDDLSRASLRELEAAAVRATRFDRRWAAAHAPPTRAVMFDSSPVVEARAVPGLAAAGVARVEDTAPSCVRALAWLPGDLLATLHASRDLLLWRVPRPEAEAEREAGAGAGHAHPTPAPRQMDVTGVFGAFPIALLVDRAPEGARAGVPTPPGVTRLCVASGAPDGRLHLSVYEVDPLHARLAFRRRVHVDAPVMKVWALVGDKILFSDPVMIVDVHTGLLSFVVQPDPNVFQPTDVIAAELIRDDQVLVVQQQAVLVLSVAAPGSGADLVGPVIFCRDWGHHTEARVIIPRGHAARAWPADTLYPSALVLALGPHALSSLPLFVDADVGAGRGGWAAGEWESFPVPPSAGALAAGAAGTGRALWLETRALPAGGPGARRGNTRPARCVLRLDVPAARDGVQIPCVPDMRVHAREIFARPCGVGEVVRRKYALVALALDDAAGRVALGNRDGTVQVLDLA